MQLLYCRARLFVSCIFYHGYYSKSFANVSERRLHARLNIARHFFFTRTRVPHARHACLVLDFSEPNCDWSKKNYVMEIVCGFVFADVIFRRSEATAGNTSAFAGYFGSCIGSISAAPSGPAFLPAREETAGCVSGRSCL